LSDGPRDAILRRRRVKHARRRGSHCSCRGGRWRPELRLESWRALERIHAEGRARAIGVSNFSQPHLAGLLAHAQTKPAVDQIELSPFLQRKETVASCREHGLVLEAYSPLTLGLRLCCGGNGGPGNGVFMVACDPARRAR
jgi:diketogulonate reductase-like aldo/keto reductase